MPLTIKKIAKLTERGRYFDQHGRYLQVISPKNKSWLLRYQVAGRERWMGLGSLALVNLEAAREKALQQRRLLRDGIDPIEAKHEQRRQNEAAQAKTKALRVTFEEATEQYFNHHQGKWRNDKHRAQFLSTMKQYAFPKIGKLVVASVDKTLVLEVLNPIWNEKPETANRVRSRIEAVLSFATFNGWRSGENPARWKGFLDQRLVARSRVRKVVHHRALPFSDIPEFMTALRSREGVAARALEFTILTASRTSEATGAFWEEFDLQAGVWTVPEDRMKANREHRVPLTEAVLSLLKTLPRENGNPYVFVGPRKDGLSNMAMDAVLRRMEYKDRTTVHVF